MASFGFRDVTGTLDGPALAVLADPDARAVVAPEPCAEEFLRAMGGYQRAVNSRYGIFLDEVGGEDAEELHSTVLRAMISGSLGGLCTWLDQRHGHHAFASLFLLPAYVPHQRETAREGE